MAGYRGGRRPDLGSWLEAVCWLDGVGRGGSHLWPVGKILASVVTSRPDLGSQGESKGWVSPLRSVELWACKEGVLPPSSSYLAARRDLSLVLDLLGGWIGLFGLLNFLAV